MEHNSNARNHPLPRALQGFENIRRYRDAQGQAIAKLLPGDYYVTCEDEVLDTVLGSCVSACIRNPRTRIGGMNHFMLPRPSGHANDNWDAVAGRATRYGSASMEQLINRILAAGGTRADLEVKVFGGGRVLASMTDVGNHNVAFVRDFLKNEGLRGRGRGRYLSAARAVRPGERPGACAAPEPCSGRNDRLEGTAVHARPRERAGCRLH